MIKILNKMGVEWTNLNIMKSIYGKPTANIKFNGEKLSCCCSLVTKSCLTLCPLIDQHTRLPCSLSPGVCSDSRPLSQCCYLTISSTAAPFSFCLQLFLASGSFPVSQYFASGGQSIGASASALPVNIQGWFPLGLTGLDCKDSGWLSELSPTRRSCVLVATLLKSQSHTGLSDQHFPQFCWTLSKFTLLSVYFSQQLYKPSGILFILRC